MSEQHYRFKFYIGDWSGDGHGKRDVFFATSNKPVDAVREAYFAAKAKMPSLCPDCYCQNREDPRIDERILARLEAAGAPPGAVGQFRDDCPDDLVRAFAEIVVWFIQQGGPELVIELAPKDCTPVLFCGYDEQNRHIGLLGYGLF